MNLFFWQTLLGTALIIVAVHNLFGPGELFGWLGDIFDRRLPKALQKPIYTCMPCQASIYGTATWLYLQGPLELYVPFILALSGLMKIVSQIMHRYE